MKRAWTIVAALTLALGACGGDDDTADATDTTRVVSTGPFIEKNAELMAAADAFRDAAQDCEDTSSTSPQCASNEASVVVRHAKGVKRLGVEVADQLGPCGEPFRRVGLNAERFGAATRQHQESLRDPDALLAALERKNNIMDALLDAVRDAQTACENE